MSKGYLKHIYYTELYSKHSVNFFKKKQISLVVISADLDLSSLLFLLPVLLTIDVLSRSPFCWPV